jgi:glycerol-3-phosphate dehydrogenase (NAD(P)+)
MARLGDACGGRPETFAGLAGMGDLIVTCESRHGRNRAAGELIARGATPDEAAAAIGQTVEGLTTAPVLRDLSHRLGIELPITEGVCTVLEGRVRLGDLVEGLMGRRPTGE